MSVAQNLALRDFDRAPLRRGGWRLDRRAMRERAAQLIDEFNVRPPLPERAIGTLSGGNVQRAVLARELGQPVDVLIVANPVFGLDFASVADIHARLMAARDAGAAVLLVSEDLDELLELADRIVGDRRRANWCTKHRPRARIAPCWASTWPDTATPSTGSPPRRSKNSGKPLDDTHADHRAPNPARSRSTPRKPRLIVIDMQRDFIEPGGFGESLGNDVSLLAEIVPSVAALLAFARRQQWLVVHTRESHAADLSDCPPAKRLRGAAERAHRRRRTDGPHPDSRRARQCDHRARSRR